MKNGSKSTGNTVVPLKTDKGSSSNMASNKQQIKDDKSTSVKKDNLTTTANKPSTSVGKDKTSVNTNTKTDTKPNQSRSVSPNKDPKATDLVGNREKSASKSGVKDTEKSTSTTKENKESKEKKEKKVTINHKVNPLDNVKREDLIIKLKDYEEKFKLEKDETKRAVESKNKELENKERTMIMIGNTNKKLLTELDELRREVDEKLDKIGGVQQIIEKEREKERMKKQMPLEQVLKVREKELKNAMNLIDVYKKDNENMSKSIKDKGDLPKMNELENKLKEEEFKAQQMESELKLFKAVKTEHKKCLQEIQAWEITKANLLKEMIKLKENSKTLQQQIKMEAEKHHELSEQVWKSKNELRHSKGEVLPDIRKPKLNTSSKILEVDKYWKMLENANSIEMLKKKSSVSSERKFSSSLGNTNINILYSNTNKETSNRQLFNIEEKEILHKLIPPKEIDKLETRFQNAEEGRNQLERKYTLDLKSYGKKIGDLEERLELSHIQVKEAEQRNKLLTFQINEHKNEKRLINKKIVESRMENKKLKLKLKEKEDESKLLMENLLELSNKVESGNNNSRSYHDEEENGENEDNEENYEQGENDEDEN
jgi:hypothetical protein